MSQKGLFGIPVELLLQILKHLEIRDLINCRAACRSLRDTINSSMELQYSLELVADNMIDGPRGPGTLTTSARHELLLDRRRRWRQLDWLRIDTISLPGTCQAYELVGGVFAKSMGGMGFDSLAGSKHLIMSWLPTRTTAAHHIIREDLGIASRDFAIDPTQDLIALVDMDDSGHGELKIRVHLRTMTSNAAHPRAKQPYLSAPISVHINSCFVQIVDDVIGMFFWVHGPGYIIWNWHTGEKLIHRSGFELPQGTWDFAFISSRAFMLTTTLNQGSIEIFSFSTDTTKADADLIHVASLWLPPVRVGQDIHNFTTHSAPFLAEPVVTSTPFYASQGDRVHAMTLQYGDRGPRVLLCVRNSFLMSHIPRDEDRATQGLRSLAWNDWGQANTRFMPGSVRSSWLRYVHGLRIVLPNWGDNFRDADDGVPFQTVCLMDFNVHPKRLDDPYTPSPPSAGSSTSTSFPSSTSRPKGSRAAANTQGPFRYDDPIGTYTIVTEPTIIPADTTFVDPVVSQLAYSMTSRRFSAKYTGFMIDDQRLVGMKETAFEEFGTRSDRDIDVFVF